MLAAYVTILEIFVVERCMAWLWSLECTIVKCRYANDKAVSDFLFVGNNNFCHYLSPFAKYSQSKCALAWLYFTNGSMTNVNIPVKWSRATSYLLAIVMFALSVTVFKIFIWCWPLPSEWAKDKCKYANQKATRDFLLLGNSKVSSVTAGEITTYELQYILDWNIWPWRWGSMAFTIWMKLDIRVYFVNTHTYGKKIDASTDPSICSCFVMVRFVTAGRTYVHAYVHPYFLLG